MTGYPLKSGGVGTPACLGLLLQEWAPDCREAAVDFTQYAESCRLLFGVFSKEGQSSFCSICLTLAVFWCRFGANLAALRCAASSLSMSFCAAGSLTVHEYSRMCAAGEAYSETQATIKHKRF